MLRYGIVLYPGDANMFDWALRRAHGFSWQYESFKENSAPVVLFTTNKTDRDVLAEELAVRYPATEFGCFTVDMMVMAPAANVKKFEVSDKGTLPV